MNRTFCFATFQDVGQDDLPHGHLPRKESLAVVEALAKASFDKINFAGGEPILCPWLPDLIRRANELPTIVSLTKCRLSGTDLFRRLAQSCLLADSAVRSSVRRDGRICRCTPESTGQRAD